MIRYCLDQWNAHEKELREVIKYDRNINGCNYDYLIGLIVKHILNAPSDKYDHKWNLKNITVIDDGDYQGTQLFLIPMDTYQPSEYDYLMSYVGYGSCSGCDTLQCIQDYRYDELPTDKQVDKFMLLCKDLITNMIRPYNHGWRANIDFETVE